MLYRNFGKVNEDVSLLGFGCMRLPLIKGTDNIDEEAATEMIRYAIDNGINYIDTAYPYHNGESENVVGRILKDGYREKVKLATKLPTWAVKTREDMDKFLDEQLAKLQTTYIDYYLVHALSKDRWENMKRLGIDDFLNKAIESGKIRYAGFSFHDDLKLFKEIVDELPWSFCQIQYNYMDENYQAGTEGLEYAAKKGLGIVVMEPLRGGALARNIPNEIKNVWGKAEIKRSAAEWAFRFIYNRPEVSVVLSGMNSMEQIDENIKVACEGIPNSLTELENAIINEVKNIYLDKTKVNCTNCKYCMPCPVGVNIPRCFQLINEASIFGDMGASQFRYNMLKPKQDPSNCVQCGKCEEACPQHIKIIDRLKEVKELFE